ncbi:MAG: YdcF family protein [Caldilineaceae bacterium]
MNQLAGLIVILGSPNDASGQLSEMGQRRVAKGYAEYQQRRDEQWKILLTGGFGAHFNTTAKPNAYYAQQLLLAWGVPPDAIVEFAESGHTLEDATLARPIVERYGLKQLLIVSSDFHLPRVRFIFEHIFPDCQLTFAAAEYISLCSVTERQRLITHEAQALDRLRTTYPTWCESSLLVARQ